jgi:hypothetical protein
MVSSTWSLELENEDTGLENEFKVMATADGFIVNTCSSRLLQSPRTETFWVQTTSTETGRHFYE